MPHVRESSAFQDFLPFKGRDFSNISNISICPEEILGTSRMEEGKSVFDHVKKLIWIYS